METKVEKWMQTLGHESDQSFEILSCDDESFSDSVIQ